MAQGSPFSMATQFIGAAGQATLGTFQYLNAIKQAQKNIRPLYSIDPSYKSNVDILTNTLGLPQSALDLYYRNIGQNTNQGISAILSSGGNANQISSLVGNQNASFENIAVSDALQRKNDTGGLIAARLALAEQNDKKWQLNIFDPYKDKAQAIASEKAAGLQNLTGAINSLSGGLANSATSNLADNITTPDSGVNTNAIMEALKSARYAGNATNQPPYQLGLPPQTTQNPNSYGQPTAQPQFSVNPQIPNYNSNVSQYPFAPQNNNLDYQAWVNYMLRAQGRNQQTNQYQYGQ